jgi:hypothetical protein
MREGATIAGFMAGVGAGIGVGVDALVHGRTRIYPLVGPDGAGALLSLRW